MREEVIITQPPSEIRPGSGRPRDRDIDERILGAARDLLAAGGYDALTFEAIASKAGIGRPTVYRRWRDKAHLVAAISYGDRNELEETGGDLAGQMRVLVEHATENYRRPEVGPGTVGLISAFHNDSVLREALHTPVEESIREQLRGIVARAKARRVMDADADADILFDMIMGAILFRLIFSSTATPDNFVDELTRMLCKAFAPENVGSQAQNNQSPQ